MDRVSDQRIPIIAFVWRPEERISAVTQMAHRTGSRAIFDFSLMEVEPLFSALRKAASAGPVRDIKISALALMDPSLPLLLQETGVENIWVECHPMFFLDDYYASLKRLRELSKICRCFPIIGDLDLLTAILPDSTGIGRIVLKGCEASGFVSNETTLALYAAVKEMMPRLSHSVDIVLWGGVSTPEAAAAFLVTGAQGIVFESVHWLTDLVAIDDGQRQRIANLRLDSTDLIGLDVQVPCRLFNKGNSIVCKAIKHYESSLCEAEITEQHRRSFADRVSAGALQPLASHFTPDDIIPLGVEAAFAASFADRFGTGTEEAVTSFMAEIRNRCRLAATNKDCFVDSPVAREMGTRYPFIQGAMSWITDVPEFALRVAEAGGLPTIALGMMDAATLDLRLGRLPEIMGEFPYAVNIVSLAENPFRASQLAWIKKHQPRFVVIAGGDLSPLKELLECGIEVIYIAPDESLLRLALEAGVRSVIIEGYEAGGHVGRHSTLTLAQKVLDLRRLHPSLFHKCHLVLAGGIFNRETAFLAALLGADAIQMGTAYLATREIVETGALTALYQRMILDSTPGGTVVSGQATGLRVRSLRTLRADAVLSLEREFTAGQQDEHSFRKNIEEMTAGSLFAAARGLDRPGGATLDERACLERGQFMSGACSGLIGTVLDLQSFHLHLAEGTLVLHQPFAGMIEKNPEAPLSGGNRVRRQIAPARNDGARIAITGMSILNALGSSPEGVWDASLAMESGIKLVPPSRWDHSLFYDPRPQVPDKTYCKVGAFLDFPISRHELGIPPHDFRTMTEATKITLWLADKAIRASGLLDSDIPRERIGVLISQNSGEAAGTLTNTIIRAYVHDIVGSITRAIHLTPDQRSAIEREVRSGRMAPDDTTLLGRLNCAAAGFICNRYGFMGPSYAVSAACATSLVALYSAIQMIKSGVIDAAIVGGGEDNLTHLHFLEFSALGALYGLSGQERPARETSRPFDAQRDGMVLGEGGGMIVIEREGSARARGARIHAVITGMGASNNHLGMVESSSRTQEIAIRASFQETPYGPEGVDLVECHGTSTRQGDVEEVRALKAFFTASKRTVLTSFKSQIGHTLGASGINSLIRGVMAMQAGFFPPTLNYRHPDPAMDLKGSGLLIAPEPHDWASKGGRLRRLQVNAFGFGGSNYVVQLEQAMDGAGAILVSPGCAPGLAQAKAGTTAAVPAESSPAGEARGGPSGLEGVSFFRAKMDGRNFRLAVVAESEEEALTVIERSRYLAEGGTVNPQALRSLAQQGIFMGNADLPAPPLALVFPGQGTHYAGMGRELYESFPVIKKEMDRAAAVADFDLLYLLFHDHEENLQKTRWQQPALFVLEYAMARYLTTLGISPVALAGHSLGELTALCLADVYSLEDGFGIVNQRALCMDKAAGLQDVDPGVMAAVDAPLDLLREMIQGGAGDVHVSNINSPHQVVVSGKTEAVHDFCTRLKDRGYRATPLRVSMAFHSPIMRVIRAELEAYVAAIPFHSPRIPVISNTTMAPYPSDSGEIRRILMAHLESPVHWMQNVQTLWQDFGVRLFVEVGPGDIVSGFITDTLPDPACIQTCLPATESLTYKTALAQLFVHGALQPPGEPQFISLPVKAAASHPVAQAPASSVPEPMGVDANAVATIMQREINRFVLETSGGLLKPIILEAIRQELHPHFQEDDLSSALQSMVGASEPLAGRMPVSPGTPAALPPPLDLTPLTPGPEQPSPPPGEGSEHQNLMEQLIGIIMEATGFNRDEIQPGMDLRKDLSIRSSRLPIIMDAAERHFAITIELEDFIDVRTVQDIAQRIATIIAAQEVASPQSPAAPDNSSPAWDGTLHPLEDEGLKRLVFHQVVVEPAASIPMAFNPGESILILSPDREERRAGKVQDILKRDFRVASLPMLFLSGNPDAGDDEGQDIRSTAGAARAAARVAGLKSLAGMVILLPQGGADHSASMEDVSRLLRGFFILLQAFLKAPGKKFVVLIHSGEGNETAAQLQTEGMLGLFLSAAQEYPAVQFRTLAIGNDTDLSAALRAALDRGYPMVEMVHRAGRVWTSEGIIAPLRWTNSAGPDLLPGDVVVISGGATGIGAHLARSLAPFHLRLVFLGRTSLTHPPAGPSGDGNKAAEIARTLAELHAAGIEAFYHTCDVADPEAVRAVVDEVVHQYGQIRGVIHGAGVLRDTFLSRMTADEFSLVTDIKFLGAWNLFQAVEKAGLRFFVGLSSVAAIQGNPGQANYAAANRMMSALLSTFRQKHSAIRFKALMLPPIEGAGMAEDPHVRDLMKRMGASYVHVAELAGLFCRELFVSPADDDWVLFMRTLPPIERARLKVMPGRLLNGEAESGIEAFGPEDFPLIEGISSLDLRREQLEAFRTFAREKDLWIEDHRPLLFVKHPLVSAAMLLETFMEAARLLYPYLQVRGVRQVRFMDMIQCPPGVPRPCKISCCRVGNGLQEVVCEVSLATRSISPIGRLTNRFTPHSEGQVILDSGDNGENLGEGFPDFPVRLDELRTGPMERAQVLKWYQDYSGLAGRYRVLERLDGAGPGVVQGQTIYRQTDDFADLANAQYQYSPYLFEALLQLTGLYCVAMQMPEQRTMIPMEIGEMRLSRICRVGERITLEARLRAQNEQGFSWDARGLDEQGRTLMQIANLRMQWVAE
ncbi:SDR family NAD(P)-dependent oxidoreductase [uncultured Desulfobulbus sp.]|uniref:SDR family NAD(P)-dependent oxidoreductase n=1 Tax=uncultured Desulfobulbus sp. TaxID=239745 RepID=UPI0029C832D8|nr:SDR family NAD(P)-dependent oxidoreductase [uncultured Desulfobulbus sp.]